MARENSPKERRKKELERKLSRRNSYDRILIVTEGSKTEPNYFEEIRCKYRLHTASVQVQPSIQGTDPLSVVRYAQKLFEKGDPYKQIQPRAFEQVYAIFDRDNHRTYFDALNLASSLDQKLLNNEKQKVKFSACASVPNFELWLLLHYQNIQTPVHRNHVMQLVSTHISGYQKGKKGSFATTSHNLPTAIKHAKALAGQFTAYTEPEPYTAIFQLVELLIKLRG